MAMGEKTRSYLQTKMEKTHKNPLLQAKEILAGARKLYSSAIVFYSGGKDSLVVLDMCSKMGFEKIVCVHKYFVPGLAVVEKQLEYARQRWGIDIIEYQSPHTVELLKMGDFNDVTDAIDNLPSIDSTDIETIARNDTGITLIATGHKRTDAFGQGLSNSEWANKEKNVVQPIVFWNKFHVLAYLKSQDIPLPTSDGRNSSSMDLHPKNIVWLYENHREDFERVKALFPYIETIIWRKKFYENQ